MHTLEVYKSKKYRTLYTGRESQIFKRLPSVRGKFRITHPDGTVRRGTDGVITEVS